MSLRTLVFIACTVFAAHSKERNLPNILFILADDLGWGNVQWEGHNPNDDEISTPNIDALVSNGLQLHRHYVFSCCSPTRASLQTGRLPVHVTTDRNDGIDDPTHGVPTKMTSIASKLKRAGYRTGVVGKWDCGFATYDHLPLSKGYDSFFGYLNMNIAYFSKKNDGCGEAHIDLWENHAPAYTSMDDIGTRFVELDFLDRVTQLIDSYAQTNDPFFLLYSMHLPHDPSEIPATDLETFPDDENHCKKTNGYVYPGFTEGDLFECRSILQSQVNLMDKIIGEVVNSLRVNNLYDNTLIVFSSDNGGSLDLSETAGNNYPLRGGKTSFFEGGIRAASFVSGGFLPKERRGEIEAGLIHISDWYSTFCALAGINSNDYDAVEAGLPNVDGLNMWPLISGADTESPRTEVTISPNVLIQGNYKWMTDDQHFSIWMGEKYPNATSQAQFISGDHHFPTLDCSVNGCLFDVVNDRSEYHNLVDSRPDLALKLNKRLQELAVDFWRNEERGVDSCPVDTGSLSCGCWMAVNNYNYFAGPYQDLKPDQIYYEESNMLSELDKESGEYRKKNNGSFHWGLMIVLFAVILLLIKCYQSKVGISTNNELNSIGKQSVDSYGTL